ncbi:MAG: hypothetical protein IPJ01_12075 [Micavibrio sp.]|nr:hypothetical protein [Micavibrio sp.]
MDFEQIFEPLKTATPETLAATLATVQGAMKDFIFQEKLTARNNARSELFGTFKRQLADTAPDAFADINDRTKYEDMLPLLGEKLKAPKVQAKAEPTETTEQMRARMQSEFDSNLKKEREKLYLDSAFSEIESAAIAKKLDPAYQPIFRAALRAELDAELSADNKVLFKSKTDGKYFTRDGAHAGASQVADDLLKKYPRFVAEPVRSPSPNGAPSLSSPDSGNMAGMNKIRAGLSELKSLAVN